MFNLDLFNICLGIVNICLALIFIITFMLFFQDNTIDHNYDKQNK